MEGDPKSQREGFGSELVEAVQIVSVKSWPEFSLLLPARDGVSRVEWYFQKLSKKV